MSDRLRVPFAGSHASPVHANSLVRFVAHFRFVAAAYKRSAPSLPPPHPHPSLPPFLLLARLFSGQIDELCTSVRGHETDMSPCSLLATPDGWRRVIFPGGNGQRPSCCKFCNITDYCGIVAPDWLRRGSAQFLGNVTFGSRVCNHW